MRSTRIVFVAVLALAAWTPSCVLFHRHKAVPAAPPAPAPAAPVALPTPHEVPLPAAPQLPAAQPDLNQAGPSSSGEALPPAPRRRPKPRPHPDPDEDADVPAPAPEPPAAAVPLPQFEQILTPEQRQAYTGEIERNIANAQKAVAALEGRRLSRDQATYLARIRAFIDQANEARKADLFRARNLAERASVLADDLLKSVQ